MYYNGARAINSGAWLILSMGNRSTGKSFYWKRHVIRRYLEHGEMFIYIRRNMVDVELSTGTFFDDVGHKFPGKEMTYKKNTFFIGDIGMDEKEPCGFAYSLTTVSKLKSIPLERVTTILFDEFIPEDLRYLKPDVPYYEPELLLSLYLTVARGFKQVIRTDVRIVCVANVITRYTPYFSYFSVDLNNGKEWTYNRKTGVFAEVFYNEEVARRIADTQAGKFISSTHYGQYALDNNALRDDRRHIGAPVQRLRPEYMLYVRGWLRVVLDPYHNRCFFLSGYDPGFPLKYRLTPGEVEDVADVPWLPKLRVQQIRRYADADGLYYGSMEIKSRIAGFFERS